MTFFSRKKSSAFCRTRLLDATPSTIPTDRHRIKVLVTTACSDCSDTASTAINVAGNINPAPMLDGARKSRYAQLGKPLVINTREVVPISSRIVPATSGVLSSRVQVMRKPVAVPNAEPHMVGTMRRRPEFVALSSRTAWK